MKLNFRGKSAIVTGASGGMGLEISRKLSQNNIYAQEVVNSWANAEWFKSKKVLQKEITCLVFKIDGETNTDDLSPAVHATTRPDIPLHALAMLEFKKQDGLEILDNLKKQEIPIAYVGDVVGTGSSRKSAINSVIWHIGEDIPFVPNKRTGGIIIGSKIAPIFFNTAQDSGALPIEADVSQMNTGDLIKIFPYEGVIKKIEKRNPEKNGQPGPVRQPAASTRFVQPGSPTSPTRLAGPAGGSTSENSKNNFGRHFYFLQCSQIPSL